MKIEQQKIKQVSIKINITKLKKKEFSTKKMIAKRDLSFSLLTCENKIFYLG